MFTGKSDIQRLSRMLVELPFQEIEKILNREFDGVVDYFWTADDIIKVGDDNDYELSYDEAVEIANSIVGRDIDANIAIDNDFICGMIESYLGVWDV